MRRYARYQILAVGIAACDSAMEALPESAEQSPALDAARSPVRQPSDPARPSLSSGRVKYGKVEHSSQQTPASGDTNSRKGLQVAGV